MGNYLTERFILPLAGLRLARTLPLKAAAAGCVARTPRLRKRCALYSGCVPESPQLT